MTISYLSALFANLEKKIKKPSRLYKKKKKNPLSNFSCTTDGSFELTSAVDEFITTYSAKIEPTIIESDT